MKGVSSQVGAVKADDAAVPVSISNSRVLMPFNLKLNNKTLQSLAFIRVLVMR